MTVVSSLAGSASAAADVAVRRPAAPEPSWLEHQHTSRDHLHRLAQREVAQATSGVGMAAPSQLNVGRSRWSFSGHNRRAAWSLCLGGSCIMMLLLCAALFYSPGHLDGRNTTPVLTPDTRARRNLDHYFRSIKVTPTVGPAAQQPATNLRARVRASLSAAAQTGKPTQEIPALMGDQLDTGLRLALTSAEVAEWAVNERWRAIEQSDRGDDDGGGSARPIMCSAGFIPHPLTLHTSVVAKETGRILLKALDHGAPAPSAATRPNYICRACPPHTFALPGMLACRPFLTCSDLALDGPNAIVSETRRITNGGVKHIKQGVLRLPPLVVDGTTLNPTEKLTHTVMIATAIVADDFEHGFSMLTQLSPHPHITQPVGYCDSVESILSVTEWVTHGAASHVDALLATSAGTPALPASFGDLDLLRTRLRLAQEYVRVLGYLHNSPLGVRVMCDGNTPIKALSQYLISEDGTLKANDLDALPQVIYADGTRGAVLRGVKCGHRELSGQFVAPEQKWPFSTPFLDELMPAYTEKTDIWKLPEIVQVLFPYLQSCEAAAAEHKAVRPSGLSCTPAVQEAFRHIDRLFSRCKHAHPRQRPPASELLQAFDTALLAVNSSPSNSS
ncbi:hypothetical protein CAOG_08172 [Capsaspora owczarzaki ATCC 30864]|uniref:Protein kinase domain-containing protein n=1 Tax=Capsaspora owczarzaki (strain ATCC 30864) TaxID=595528 RepID=A0A0D2WXW5_CAPO3|nr:hypothetical protein CAOG_08172 [Capsaspora owczarzaki ATCC 30864]KJE98165.1 hypothetical protein CAOG_008172 [Capsaspora owczarzaki ATCC 30864]|eukprot:XP_004342773.2 hypothetical protein CAOG_08172 [Capsaspora owczarzaki ATCC 30864]